MQRPRLSLALLGLAFMMTGWVAAAEPLDEPKWSSGQKAHWSLVAPTRPDVPTPKAREWVRNPIDAFILDAIETMELAPSAEADRLTLIRRLTFDLTGLPPTPSEAGAFVDDQRPDAYERLVDRLLATPQYGERMARAWLDLARFAESDGFKSDVDRPNAWRYRDWVIEALNADMSYNTIVAQQLAGDEIKPGNHDAFIATGFNRNFPFEDNKMVPGLNRQLILDDVTDTTASVFLGLTVACARCHDHKYDPISQRDYYRLQAIFAATGPKDDASLAPPLELAFHTVRKVEVEARVDAVKRRRDVIERPYQAAILKANLEKIPLEARKAFETDPIERSAFQEELLKRYAPTIAITPAAMKSALKPEDQKPWTDLTKRMESVAKRLPPSLDTASGMTDLTTKAPVVHLLFKGTFGNLREEVAPGFLSVLDDRLPKFQDRPTPTSSGRRKALAEWLTRPEHPLTSRVMVNRIWQTHFGRGIVTTTSDFGTQGAEPSHPELLDWLATEFVARGWSMKAMHRLMVTSSTYRQSSKASERTVEADPENALFSRMVRRRLEGEAVRDALLAVGDNLNLKVGGPSVFPDLPPGIQTRSGWPRSASEAERNRRSVYVFVRRNLKFPLLDAFDFPDTNVTCAERNVSVNAPQALMLLNSEFVVDEARLLAGRLLKDPATRNEPKSLIQNAYKTAFGREPSSGELSRGQTFLEEQPAILSARAGDLKALSLPKPFPDGHSPAQGAALVDYCHVLLNLNEFVYVD